ncbi:VUT family protein [Amphiplicatus metriothermophilus]|uniref:Uncharacterized protein n=1 Tax=Amphiplicatus metriothermophilus TaxID=1519374 RepID=A0A239PPL0_9PROT|nr:VUT family protein [Amphiplicatus metriothermophilus]MBB5518608.1 hypothetical protein [Amphiplicatus metriothermophilus]SNT72234.1 hypothetical protein SAMN06297382_1271 [Amphiplicatus metriothermophilus]
MEAATTVVEKRRPVKETPAQRLARETAAFAAALGRMALLAAILSPVLLWSFLTVDLPVRSFDRLVDTPALKPSLWLSIGGLAMTGALPLVILVTRRFGGDEASRAVTAAWGVSAVATLAGLSYLAPFLESHDMPSVRFVAAFVASAMLGQYVAIGMYDVLRGGGVWWRAPLFAALAGYGVQTAIYFPAAHAGAGAAWFNWMVTDYALKTFAAFAFLPVYFLLRKTLRPRGGYGGR